ncbi:protein ERGIC-53 [Exaiptasia diaphana]|uniref:L-type lectin-like domain-containing protein n=1 Tax=Exaiptasia diaphana TaxID=2652724 RepID=A0A913WY33_EXADI|nr:protein ERGIC-53 [Exaiptasia diaphana]KXJ16900.1 Protein ERGIC-53 [Exaiptasia diaphana]
MAVVKLSLSAFLLLFFPSVLKADAGERHVKYEYKYSFKGPHLMNKQGQVPFWTYGGSAIPSNDQVRLTPSLRDRKGYLWTKEKFTSEWWEIEGHFRVTGRGRVGADGMAIWYTETAGTEGPVFGSTDNWKGLAVLCDSFDNDGEQNNPFVSVMVNDGTKSYEHHNDGKNQNLGGCLRDFRNRPHPIRVRIRYYQNVLTLWFHMGMSTKPEDFELCTRVENVHLAKEGFFGVSAATGGLADDHDVLSFSTLTLTPPSKDAATQGGLSQEEQDKLTKQYEEYQKNLEKQKEEYAQAHPDKVKKDELQYESAYERDIRLVYEGQNAIHNMLNQLHAKTGELTVQANTLHTLVSTDHNRMSNMVTMDKTINRQEVGSIISVQQQMLTKLEDIKNAISGMKTGGMDRRSADDTGVTSQLNDMQGAMDSLVHTVNNMASKQQFAGDKKKDCPPPPPPVHCIGPGSFVFLIIAQIVMLVGYITYRNQKEAAAKKFF